MSIHETSVKNPDKFDIKLKLKAPITLFAVWPPNILNLTLDFTTNSNLILENKGAETKGEDVNDAKTKIYRHGTNTDAPPKFFLKSDFSKAIKIILNLAIANLAFRLLVLRPVCIQTQS